MATTVTFEVESIPDITQYNSMVKAKSIMQDWAMSTWRGIVADRMSGQGVNRRTGNLARDWVVDTQTTSDGLESVMFTQGTANAYAGILEWGGTITPKNGKFLWMPLAANLTSKGVARITPSQAIEEGGFVHYGNGNPTFLGKPQTKQSSRSLHMAVVPLFVLLRSVTIRPQLGVSNYFQTRIPMLETALLANMGNNK